MIYLSQYEYIRGTVWSAVVCVTTVLALSPESVPAMPIGMFHPFTIMQPECVQKIWSDAQMYTNIYGCYFYAMPTVQHIHVGWGNTGK